MQRPAIAGERIKSPHVESWIDVRGRTKPRPQTERARLAIEFFTDRLGEYVSRRELARYVGSASTNVDSLLSDLEAQDTGFVIWWDEDRHFESLMAVPKRWL